jgi:aryl-alcohol dehydrogenase-like predicted oxidoreductase
MQNITLGRTGLQVSRIAFGTWQLGGDWGPTDEAAAIAAIRRAADQGVTLFDTAQAYGFGASEELLAKALAGTDRSQLIIATKGGLRPDEAGGVARDSSPAWIRAGVEASLRALETDYIDLYQVHWPDPVDEVDEGWAAFAELKEQGVVRHIGVCNFDPAQLRRVQRLAPVETLQSPYSLIARGVEAETLPLAVREGIGVIVYSPMGSGLLTGTMTPERIAGLPDNDWRKHDDDFREPRLAGNLAAAAKIARVAGRLGVAPGAAAVAWTLRNPAVTAAIVGFRRAGQVPAILAAAAGDLDDLDLDGPDLDLHRGGAGC